MGTISLVRQFKKGVLHVCWLNDQGAHQGLWLAQSCMCYTNPSKLIHLEVLSRLVTHPAVYMHNHLIGAVLSAVTVNVCAMLSTHLNLEPFIIPSFYQLWYYNYVRLHTGLFSNSICGNEQWRVSSDIVSSCKYWWLSATKRAPSSSSL